MNPEIPKFIDSITKRVYPLTEKEKNCINEHGKMIIKRGHLKKAIIETISKYEQQGTSQAMEEGIKEDTPIRKEIYY